MTKSMSKKERLSKAYRLLVLSHALKVTANLYKERDEILTELIERAGIKSGEFFCSEFKNKTIKLDVEMADFIKEMKKTIEVSYARVAILDKFEFKNKIHVSTFPKRFEEHITEE